MNLTETLVYHSLSFFGTLHQWYTDITACNLCSTSENESTHSKTFCFDNANIDSEIFFHPYC